MKFDITEAPLKPAHTVETYTRMIALAIGTRQHDFSLKPDFKLCVPFIHLPELARHFPSYQYNVLGFCFTDRQHCLVLFRPIFTRP